MREIKFRAWNKNSNRMVKDVMVSGNYVAQHGFDMYGGSTLRYLDDPTDAWKYYIPMQYTGLKDNNGVEIYEGDILSEPEQSPRAQMKTRRHSIVVFRDNGWKRDTYNGYINVFPSINCRVMEVIGNIYENPELLEVK